MTLRLSLLSSTSVFGMYVYEQPKAARSKGRTSSFFIEGSFTRTRQTFIAFRLD